MTIAVRRQVASGCDCDVAIQPRLVPIEQARDDILAGAKPLLGSETVPVLRARGRVVSEPVASAVPLPRFDNSAMDGYAIHADDLARDHPLRLRLTDRVAAGRCAIAALQSGTTVQILTGAPVPRGVAAVVPHEETRRSGDCIVVGTRPAPGANIRHSGEDIARGEPLVASGTRLDVRHIALLLAAGIRNIAVARRVRVGLLSTGDELADANEDTGDHRIVDTNRPLLSGLLDGPDIELHDFGIVADRKDAVAECIRIAAAECDLLVTTGGICGSDADHVAPAIRAGGGECRQIKLALKPGKPIGFGRLGATTILCLPGNPVSVLVTAMLFLRPLLRHLAGVPQQPLLGVPAFAADVLRHVPGRTEFVPVQVMSIESGNRRRLRSLPRGSHRLSSLAAADGFAEIACERGDIQPGQPLVFHPFDAAWSL
jgi:molybdopterin molybdotransferase